MIQKFFSLFLIFLSGIGLNLTPCVYPLIPITVSYFGARSDQIKGKSYIHAFAYVMGIALTNSLLALLATFTGSMLGSILQKPYVIVCISILLFILALSLFGYWEPRIPSKLTRILSKEFSGYRGSFFIGLFFGIFAAPCAGPFIVGLMLYIAKQADPVTGFFYFLALSLGMGLPIGILATFSGMINRLPSSGEWMLWVKRIFAWILVFMAVYMLRPILGQRLERWFLSIVLFASGIDLGFMFKNAQISYFKKAFGAFLILLSFYPIISYHDYHEQKLSWLPYRESIIEKARLNKKPILIDFYAEWCLSCKHMEKILFQDPKIISMCKRFTLIKVDLTKQLPEQKRLLKKFDIKGLPTFVFITQNRTFMLEGEIKPDVFLEKLKQVLKQYPASDLSYLPFQNLWS